MDHDRTQDPNPNQNWVPPRIELAFPTPTVTASARRSSPDPIPRPGGPADLAAGHPEYIAVNTGPQSTALHPSSSTEKDDGETLSNSGHALHPAAPMRMSGRQPSMDRRGSTGPRSGIDWIVPLDDKPVREKTVGERLEPTLLKAIVEKEKYAFKARLTGYALNIAIGMQVLLGALTTGLSAVTTGRQTSVMTAILGGLSTLVASYLARARGSNEPELSITRVKDLEQFIRECDAFKMDCGHLFGDKYDDDLKRFRNRFEELLGNANGERRLSPPV